MQHLYENILLHYLHIYTKDESYVFTDIDQNQAVP